MFFRKKANTAPAPESEPVRAPTPASDQTKQPSAQMAAMGSSSTSAQTKQAGAVAPDRTDSTKKPLPALNSDLSERLGKLISALMYNADYKNLTLGDLASTVLPPLGANQYVVAEARLKEQDVMTPVGMVLWAKISDALDRKLSAAPDQKISLKGSEWTSGDNIWLIETSGPPHVIDAMIKQLVDGPLKGRTFKVRVRGKDGRVSIKDVDPVLAQSA